MRLWLRIRIKPETLIPLLMKKGWTQGKLAREIGVSGAYVSMIMYGRYSPSGKLQHKMLKAFRGMSHKPGGRLTWEDLFHVEDGKAMEGKS